MVEEKIIKFYREKSGLTQAQLCEGICSVTHLSKIERGLTEYSKEITGMLAQRLKINLQAETNRYHRLSKKLQQWEQAIVMQHGAESKTYREELEKEPLIKMPEFQQIYQLLSVRYFLFNQDLNTANQLIKEIQRQEGILSGYTRNMLKHIIGIYYFQMGEFRHCIEHLTKIDIEHYNNEEYFYHLALAYHSVHSNITAYYYGKKALSFFQRTLNILRIIDTELMLIVQLNAKELHHFEETKEKYEQLLKLCDSVRSPAYKAKVYHNFGFECYRRKLYSESVGYFNDALALMDQSSPQYLTTLYQYINASYRGKLTPVTTLLTLAEKGFKGAKKINSPQWMDFQMVIYEIKDDNENYYTLIEETILPYYQKIGYFILVEHYERKLFYYYSEKGDLKKAMKIAHSYIGSKTSFYDHH
ncbi:helix-turn-helix transcriptional regulator [Bacillus sp. 1780r2a1]|uniref:helix-turn-helix domain-containing protein n=1 Tax=Priestia sp. GS2 TaxID=3117403 RepID=UPI0021FE9A12|nr:helix-turn-helix transcriptional regulator [Bacillus sp. 1780r2a1]